NAFWTSHKSIRFFLKRAGNIRSAHSRIKRIFEICIEYPAGNKWQPRLALRRTAALLIISAIPGTVRAIGPMPAADRNRPTGKQGAPWGRRL
ncbi:MAG TPA: hypothetical protein PLG12_09925, partial [Verrucomicrobiota bacterium]|nr:hypothetical protein [Verrucomicrobiota bacterium]